MSSKKFITFHIVSDIPWSNLNRDDTGTPKRTILGGVERGLLSSQSIKRAIRKDFEDRILSVFPVVDGQNPSEDNLISHNGSIRSRRLPEWVANRAKKIAEEAGVSVDKKTLLKRARAISSKLVGGSGEDTSIWLSVEELEAFAQVVADETLAAEYDKKELDFIIPEDRRTGSLAIAAFGRMFASAQNKQTEAAISVSPAISMHASIIETDYFITADDYNHFNKAGDVDYTGAGAAHIGTKLYTNGIFYRTITVDVGELHKNWTGVSSDHAEELLTQFVRSAIRSLPTGNKNHTAPYTLPTLVIIEEQNYREALSIAKPVAVDSEEGFVGPSVKEILRQHKISREFNSENYGETLMFGSEAPQNDFYVTEESAVAEVVDWILEYKAPVMTYHNSIVDLPSKKDHKEANEALSEMEKAPSEVAEHVSEIVDESNELNAEGDSATPNSYLSE